MEVYLDKVAIIRDAILNHKQVTGLCNRLPREFCPHILGRNDRGGWTTLTWQFEGMSEKGLPEDLAELASREGPWHRGYYSGRGEQHCVKAIDTAIDAEHSAQLRETFGGRIRQRGLQPPRRKR